ncbi:MAG TPA: PAS domain S-box protein [Allosphingosinicella sp.]|uniref:sensor histidine kinase n=1 Tax=Allosphingosinicella sp. TaxID=2823234 RepID=UPI002ED87279
MAATHLRVALCALLIALGLAVAAGWLFGIEPLKSVVPGLSTMKFNTALGFIVFGFGTLGAGSEDIQRRRRAAGAGAFLILLGLVTLTQYVSGASFGIDELVVRDTGVLSGSGVPGRMSPLTAVAWLSLGAALALVAVGRTSASIAAGHFLSLGGGFVAFLAAAGYAFGAEAFWEIGFYTAMAFHTAVGLMVSVAAILLTRQDEGWLASLGDAPATRALFVKLIPFALLLPLAVGFLILIGSGFGAYNAAFGLALFVPFMTIALTALALVLARQARGSELAALQGAAALRQTEDRYRRIFEQTSDIIIAADLDQVITDCNPAAAEAVGLSREEAIGRGISGFVSAEDFERTTAMLRQKLEGGGTTRYDVRVRNSRGDWLFWEINSGLTYDDAGMPIGLHVVGRDITERKRAEEHQRLLVNELNHRVKNSLAVVQGLAHQTLRNGNVDPAVQRSLEGRLAALAAAHDVLTRESWCSASMRDIIEEAVALFCSDGRCSIEGPALRLNPRAAVSLALAIHELGTNAAKYGAFQSDAGQVAIEWKLMEGRLIFSWIERGGPKVAVPTRRGFGTRMIERGLAGELDGEVELSFDPEGFRCVVSAPAPKILEAA